MQYDLTQFMHWKIYCELKWQQTKLLTAALTFALLP